MKKDIVIKIPDTLSEKEETALIFKKLAIKQLSGSAKKDSQKRIGDFVEVKHLTTTITIIRECKEKPIEFIKCYCGCEFQKGAESKYFHNYGGVRKIVEVCSKDCLDFVIENFGERVSRTKGKLKRLIKFL